MAELVRVRNLRKTPLRVAYNSVPVVVPGEGDAVMEREAACIHFGNWDLRNKPESNVPEIRDARRLEYQRLRGLYGGNPLIVQFDGNEENYLNSVPKVEIYLMDGTKVVGVLEDPEGKDLPIIGASETEKEELLSSMQSQIEALSTKIAELSAPPPMPPVPTDSPETATRRGRPRTIEAAGE